MKFQSLFENMSYKSVILTEDYLKNVKKIINGAFSIDNSTNRKKFNVVGDVNLTSEFVKNGKCTLVFGKVKGSFKASNLGLTSLENMPYVVDGDIDLSGNKIKSLDGCPWKVSGTLNMKGSKFNANEVSEFCQAGNVEADYSAEQQKEQQKIDIVGTSETPQSNVATAPNQYKNMKGKIEDLTPQQVKLGPYISDVVRFIKFAQEVESGTLKLEENKKQKLLSQFANIMSEKYTVLSSEISNNEIDIHWKDERYLRYLVNCIPPAFSFGNKEALKQILKYTVLLIKNGANADAKGSAAKVFISGSNLPENFKAFILDLLDSTQDQIGLAEEIIESGTWDTN